MNNNLSIYVHWPWCKTKCPYCDFNSHKFNNDISDAEMIQAYSNEINIFYNLIGNKKVTSIFFGGGTPSLMSPQTCNKIINLIKKKWPLIKNAEIKLEANPRDINKKLILELKDTPINRISLGVQSFNDKELVFLGRDHSSKDCSKSLDLISKHYDNFSFDLICCLPNTSLQEWEKQLKHACNFIKGHISIYQLTIEKGTRFFSLYKSKSFQLPDDELSLKILENSKTLLEQKGLKRYEVSNYAKKNYECLHNKEIWKYKSYLGIGPGAHSRVNIENQIYAIDTERNPYKWKKKLCINESSVKKKILLNINEKIKEILIMGLRLSEGINLNEIDKIIHNNFISFLDPINLKKATDDGLIFCDENNLRATNKGFNVLNSLIFSLIRYN